VCFKLNESIVVCVFAGKRGFQKQNFILFIDLHERERKIGKKEKFIGS